MGMFRTKPLKAVDNVSFAIQPGETLGLVGESGCGKTTVGRTILHLYKPTGGEVLYKGRKIQTKADIQAFRNKASMAACTAGVVAFSPTNGPPGTACMTKKVIVITTQIVRIARPIRLRT